MKLSDFTGWSPSLYAFIAMAVAVLTVTTVFTVKNAALRDKLANEQLARKDLEAKLALYKTAALWRADKLADHVDRGNKDYAARMDEIKNIESGKLPESPEQARVWALSILQREGK